MFTINKDKIFLVVAVLAVILTGSLLFMKSSFSGMLPSIPFLNGNANAVAQKSVDYLNNNILPEGQTATLGNVTQASGVIKLEVKIGENSYDSYVTNDGKLFFPEAFKTDAPAPAN